MYESNRPIETNVNREAANIRKIIIQSSNKSIPQSKPLTTRTPDPWWNPQLTLLKQEKNKLFNKLNKDINNYNMINYKRAKARLKREIKVSKSKSLYNLTSEIHISTPPKRIWNNISSLGGYKTFFNIHCVQSMKPSL